MSTVHYCEHGEALDELKEVKAALETRSREGLAFLERYNALLTRLERAERVAEAVATQAKQHGPRCNCLGPYGSCNMRLEPTVCDALTAWQEARDARM